RLAEERERVRHAVAEKLTQGTPLADVMEFIARHVTKADPELLIAIFLKQRSGALRVEAAPELTQVEVRSLVDMLASPGGGVAGEVASTRRRHIADQVIYEPVLGSSGQLIAVVAFYHPRAAKDRESLAGSMDHTVSLVANAV